MRTDNKLSGNNNNCLLVWRDRVRRLATTGGYAFEPCLGHMRYAKCIAPTANSLQ